MTSRLDRFLDAYVETAQWADGSGEQHGTDGDPDLAPRDEQDMRDEAMIWFKAIEATLEAAIDTGMVKCGPDFDAWGHAGHDFWLTRNGHGAGFWDGDWPEPWAALLSESARKAGEVELTVDDAGMLRAYTLPMMRRTP